MLPRTIVIGACGSILSLKQTKKVISSSKGTLAVIKNEVIKVNQITLNLCLRK